MMVGAVHVLPDADAIEHADDGCLCGPDYWCRIVYQDHGDHAHIGWSAWLVTHHSLDGRENHEADHDQR